MAETRGKFVLGLQPDDRMPNDWLRMVARVFAAYRAEPLEESIVAYIDGLNISLFSENNNTAEIKITSGQAFVDDQFIGFETDSYLTIDKRWLNIGEEYCVTLKYEWVNQMPPQEPHFMLAAKNIAENSQQMLCLGYVILQADGTLEVIDQKVPWYMQMLLAMIKDTEVDGPEWLPYLIAIKENETYDIGWALDFHHNVGNNVDYNVRLHTDRENDGRLYINGKEIIAGINPEDPNLPDDPNDPGDTFITINNNMTIVDNVYNIHEPTSNSGTNCYSMKVVNDDTGAVTGASICFDGINNRLNIRNKNNFDEPSDRINLLTLTETPDLVTINGHPIWHQGNLESSGKTIYYLGVYSEGDINNFPDRRLDGTSLEDGDTLYNTAYHAYFYFQDDKWVQVGKRESVKNYEFEATEGQTSVKCEYNPDFVVVTVAGIVLSRSDYVANNGTDIIFNRQLEEGEIVSIFTVLSGQAMGLQVGELSDVTFINLTDGDVLSYDATLNKWINRGSSVYYLSQIGDVEITSPEGGDILVWDEINSVWVNNEYPSYSIHDLNNVILTDPVENDILQLKITEYPDGSIGPAWINKTPQDAFSNIAGVMPGVIVAYAGENIPDGYLECDGSAISRVVYSALFAAIGTRFGSGDGSTTFNIPDLRGEFIRGLDTGRGIDNGRVLGTYQGDAIRNITGQIGKNSSSSNSIDALFLQNSPPSSGAFHGTEGTYKVQSATGSIYSDIVGKLSFDASRVVPTANENRPRNMALYYLIKY